MWDDEEEGELFFRFEMGEPVAIACVNISFQVK